jgi:hypothetical protein
MPVRIHRYPLWFASVVAVLAIRAETSTAAAVECQADRSRFEILVSLRMLNYSLTNDSWSPRAKKWADEIAENNRADRSTASLDGAYSRFRQYCDAGDAFMAGLTLGEWVGLALSAP